MRVLAFRKRLLKTRYERSRIMTNNTALSAKNGQFQSAEQIAENVTSRDEEHKRFFLPYLTKCRYGDVYHAVLVLWQRIALQFLENTETRKNIKAICDFKSGRVKAECKGNLMIALHDGWITSRSAKVVSMAFNFYNNGTPSVYDYDDAEEQLTECRQYTVEDLFCCGYANPTSWIDTSGRQ